MIVVPMNVNGKIECVYATENGDFVNQNDTIPVVEDIESLADRDIDLRKIKRLPQLPDKQTFRPPVNNKTKRY